MILLSLPLAQSEPPPAPVRTVASVDLQKYLGLWYEVASIPQSFQKDCIKNTTAEYSLDTETDYIVVMNSCLRADGTTDSAEGRARVASGGLRSKAQLEVTFVKLGDWIFAAGGDYWIIGLDKQYRWAVVGHPSHDYAWILSRTPNLSRRYLKQAAQILEKKIVMILVI